MVARSPISLTVQLHRTRIQPEDRVFAASEGTVDGKPVEVKLTARGLYIVLQGASDSTYGVNINELVQIAAAGLEAQLQLGGQA